MRKRISELWRRTPGLEDELRSGRPEPSRDFVRSLATRIHDEARPARRPSLRVALVAAALGSLLVTTAALGGFGYAGSAARQAAGAVESLFIANHEDDAIGVDGLNAGGDQYQPGFSWGDPNHNHDGAPGIVRKGGPLAPPLVARCDGGFAKVTFKLVVDEQAVLRLNVLDPDGGKLLLSQNDSSVGGSDVDGKPSKTLRYQVLVPRTIRVSLSVPCNLLEQGGTYRVRVSATDPNGNRSFLSIPFHAQTETS